MLSLLAALVISIAYVDSSDTYTKLLTTIERHYAELQQDYDAMAKAPRYRWIIVSIDDFPWHCASYDPESSDEDIDIYVEDYDVIIRHPKGDRTRALVAVKSYIDKGDIIRARVHRLYFYKKNSYGNWYEERKCVKAAEDYNVEGHYFYCSE